MLIINTLISSVPDPFLLINILLRSHFPRPLEAKKKEKLGFIFEFTRRWTSLGYTNGYFYRPEERERKRDIFDITASWNLALNGKKTDFYYSVLGGC